jgi:hypothetical protein
MEDIFDTFDSAFDIIAVGDAAFDKFDIESVEVASSAGTQIVENAHFVLVLAEFTDVASDKAAAACYENSFHKKSFLDCGTRYKRSSS